MRLLAYLNESRTRPIKEDEFIKLINTTHKDSVKNLGIDNCIFRGAYIEGMFSKTNPKNGDPRVSANSSNEYTLLVDNLPCWKGYPKRSRSLICSTSFETAHDYGDGVNIVLPKNGSKIGVCDSNDFWVSFPYLSVSMDIRNMDSFNHILGTWIGEDNDKNWNTLKSAIANFDEVHKDETDWIEWWRTYHFLLSEQLYTKWDSMGRNLMRVLNDILDPKKNGFTLEKIGKSYFPNDREVWTDGECINVYVEKDELETINWIKEQLR